MVAVIAFAACLFPIRQTGFRNDSLDLFLIADSGSETANAPGSSVKHLLQPLFRSLERYETAYVLFEAKSSPIEGALTFHIDETTVSHPNEIADVLVSTESAARAGLPITKSIHSLSMISKTRPFAVDNTSGQTTWDTWAKTEATYMAPFENLRAYVAKMDHGSPADKLKLKSAIVVSADSVEATKKILSETLPNFKGVCICAAGKPDRTAPNLLPLPQPGVAAHYVLFYQNHTWKIDRSEYLNSNDLKSLR